MSDLTYAQRLEALRPVLDAWCSKGPATKEETIDCPGCGGRLHVTREGYTSKPPKITANCENAFCIHTVDL